jgi:catechol 2,3-dioxygenase-like lactoylglutathione lyase family enzyme
MRRLHVHVRVADLERSIGYYTALFGEAPTVRKSDYAKWMLEDPRVNFAMSPTGGETGIDHLGFQVDSGDELGVIADRLRRADEPVEGQEQAQCCYALSDKAWSRDPQGVVWENFLSHGQIEIKGTDSAPADVRACCGGTPESEARRCCA